jgi:hypothetical protein
MEDENSGLTVLLREEDRPCDEVFVDDVDWLIGLDIDLATRRRDAMRRWSIDLGSAVAVGAVGYVIADNAQGMAFDIPAVLSIPLLIAAFVPALWLFTRSQSLAT